MQDKQRKSKTPEASVKPRVGISSCLLGEKVRYDGGHKFHRIIVEIVGSKVDWVLVCPEIEVGMGVPREPVNLVGPPESPALFGVGTGKNWTREMQVFSRQKFQALKEYGLNGFIFKDSSPSCGLRDVKVFENQSMDQSVPLGIGMFAREFLREFPDLPVVEEGELATEQDAIRFIENIKRHYRLQEDRPVND